MTFAAQLIDHWHSGSALIEVVTEEETRAIALCADAAKKLGVAFGFWSRHRGIDPIDKDARDPSAVLDAIARHDGPVMVALLDYHIALQDPATLRRLRDMLPWFAANDRCLVLVTPRGGLPEGVRVESVRVNLDPPDERELAATLMHVAGDVAPGVSLSESSRQRAVNAAIGLASTQARRAFARALRRDPDCGDDAVSLIVAERTRFLAEDLGLDLIDTREPIEALGGLEGFKSWLTERKVAIGADARRFGIDPPRGVLLLGVQGCGKSLSAKCAATHLGLGLVRLDLPRVMGASSEGPSAEESLRRALMAVESLAPVALWVDEIEKAFAGASPGRSGDSRAARLLGAFSTWLQERRKLVFVVATANDVSGLPPELLRRGRFDELFFVDLPDLEARETILALHLKRRGRNKDDYALRLLAERCANFSGAELEQVVVAALHRAFAAGRALTDGDLQRSAQDAIPLFKTYEENIKALREWARGRARSAGREGALVELFRRAP